MKTLKIITFATLAVVAAALLISTVAAMGPFGYNANTGYGNSVGRGGMMGRGGGMMGGYGYNYGTPIHKLHQHNTINQSTPPCSAE